MEDFMPLDGLTALFANPHNENFKRGYRHMKRAFEFDEVDLFKSAIDEFLEVDEDDKLYLQVAAKFNLAICHCMLCNFDRSRSYISEVQNTEYSFFTLNKRTIDSFINECPSLRSKVDLREQEYRRYLESLRAERDKVDEIDVVPSRNKWKIAAIVLITLFIILAICFIITLL